MVGDVDLFQKKQYDEVKEKYIEQGA